VLVAHVAHVAEPVVGQADAGIVQRGADARAAVMAAQDDVLDLQHVDRELQHGQRVQVRVRDDVGDVTVDEEFARRHAQQFIRGHAAVRTADPEVFRSLLRSQVLEEVRVFLDHRGRPFAVTLEQVGSRQAGRRFCHVLFSPLLRAALTALPVVFREFSVL